MSSPSRELATPLIVIMAVIMTAHLAAAAPVAAATSNSAATETAAAAATAAATDSAAATESAAPTAAAAAAATETATAAATEVDPTAAPADVAAPPAGAERTPSGLAFKVLVPGTGKEHPGPSDRVKVHYTGWTTDGNMFDSSVRRGAPLTLGLGSVIAGWTEGLQLMTVGERRRLWIPENLAYKGQQHRPQGMLVFDVELLAIEPAPPKPDPPETPADLAGPPDDAVRTSSGLAFKILRPARDTVSPTPDSFVEIHYTGWTADGRIFDSSVVRGRPTTVKLESLIAGLVEGLQLMGEGEKRRFWIPQELAYRGYEGRPAGMLVFDVELRMVL